MDIGKLATAIVVFCATVAALMFIMVVDHESAIDVLVVLIVIVIASYISISAVWILTQKGLL